MGEAAPGLGPRYQRLLSRAEADCRLLSVTLEITLDCNLRCVHCYNFDRALTVPRARGGNPLSDDDIHRVIDEVRGEGALFLALTGGEPTTHPALESFVSHAARSGLLVRLKSNGTRLTAQRAAGLARAGLRAVDVSVYGAAAPTHDRFVCQPGAFEKTVAGVRNALEAGLEVGLSFVITATNAGEVDGMRALAEDIGVPAKMDTHVTARHDGGRTSLSVELTPELLEDLYRGPLSAFVHGHPEERGSIACPCARSVCGIVSSGHVYPCISAPISAGNVREQSFGAIWRSSPTFARIRSLRKQDFPACASCAHSRWCSRTSGVMLSNTGSFTGPAKFGDDLMCHEAALRHRLDLERRPRVA